MLPLSAPGAEELPMNQATANCGHRSLRGYPAPAAGFALVAEDTAQTAGAGASVE